MSLFIHMVGLA